MRHGWPNYHEQPSKNVAYWFGKDYRLNGVIAAGSPGDRVGDTVCQAGHKTAGTNHCGQIISVDWDCSGHTGMRQTDYSSTGGDSGATVYRFVGGKKRQIAGLHEGKCGGDPRYTFQQNAINALPGTVAWYTD